MMKLKVDSSIIESIGKSIKELMGRVDFKLELQECYLKRLDDNDDTQLVQTRAQGIWDRDKKILQILVEIPEEYVGKEETYQVEEYGAIYFRSNQFPDINLFTLYSSLDEQEQPNGDLELSFGRNIIEIGLEFAECDIVFSDTPDDIKFLETFGQTPGTNLYITTNENNLIVKDTYYHLWRIYMCDDENSTDLPTLDKYGKLIKENYKYREYSNLEISCSGLTRTETPPTKYGLSNDGGTVPIIGTVDFIEYHVIGDSEYEVLRGRTTIDTVPGSEIIYVSGTNDLGESVEEIDNIFHINNYLNFIDYDANTTGEDSDASGIFKAQITYLKNGAPKTLESNNQIRLTRRIRNDIWYLKEWSSHGSPDYDDGTLVFVFPSTPTSVPEWFTIRTRFADRIDTNNLHITFQNQEVIDELFTVSYSISDVIENNRRYQDIKVIMNAITVNTDTLKWAPIVDGESTLILGQVSYSGYSEPFYMIQKANFTNSLKLVDIDGNEINQIILQDSETNSVPYYVVSDEDVEDLGEAKYWRIYNIPEIPVLLNSDNFNRISGLISPAIQDSYEDSNTLVFRYPERSSTAQDIYFGNITISRIPGTVVNIDTIDWRTRVEERSISIGLIKIGRPIVISGPTDVTTRGIGLYDFKITSNCRFTISTPTNSTYSLRLIGSGGSSKSITSPDYSDPRYESGSFRFWIQVDKANPGTEQINLEQITITATEHTRSNTRSINVIQEQVNDELHKLREDGSEFSNGEWLFDIGANRIRELYGRSCVEKDWVRINKPIREYVHGTTYREGDIVYKSSVPPPQLTPLNLIRDYSVGTTVNQGDVVYYRDNNTYYQRTGSSTTGSPVTYVPSEEVWDPLTIENYTSIPDNRKLKDIYVALWSGSSETIQVNNGYYTPVCHGYGGYDGGDPNSTKGAHPLYSLSGYTVPPNPVPLYGLSVYWARIVYSSSEQQLVAGKVYQRGSSTFAIFRGRTNARYDINSGWIKVNNYSNTSTYDNPTPVIYNGEAYTALNQQQHKFYFVNINSTSTNEPNYGVSNYWVEIQALSGSNSFTELSERCITRDTAPMWDSNEFYNVGDLVIFGDSCYLSLKYTDGTDLNTGKTPNANPEWWKKLSNATITTSEQDFVDLNKYFRFTVIDDEYVYLYMYLVAYTKNNIQPLTLDLLRVQMDLADNYSSNSTKEQNDLIRLILDQPEYLASGFNFKIKKFTDTNQVQTILYSTGNESGVSNTTIIDDSNIYAYLNRDSSFICTNNINLVPCEKYQSAGFIDNINSAIYYSAIIPTIDYDRVTRYCYRTQEYRTYTNIYELYDDQLTRDHNKRDESEIFPLLNDINDLPKPNSLAILLYSNNIDRYIPHTYYRVKGKTTIKLVEFYPILNNYDCIRYMYNEYYVCSPVNGYLYKQYKQASENKPDIFYIGIDNKWSCLSWRSLNLGGSATSTVTSEQIKEAVTNIFGFELPNIRIKSINGVPPTINNHSEYYENNLDFAEIQKRIYFNSDEPKIGDVIKIDNNNSYYVYGGWWKAVSISDLSELPISNVSSLYNVRFPEIEQGSFQEDINNQKNIGIESSVILISNSIYYYLESQYTFNNLNKNKYVFIPKTSKVNNKYHSRKTPNTDLDSSILTINNSNINSSISRNQDQVAVISIPNNSVIEGINNLVTNDGSITNQVINGNTSLFSPFAIISDNIPLYLYSSEEVDDNNYLFHEFNCSCNNRNYGYNRAMDTGYFKLINNVNHLDVLHNDYFYWGVSYFIQGQFGIYYKLYSEPISPRIIIKNSQNLNTSYFNLDKEGLPHERRFTIISNHPVELQKPDDGSTIYLREDIPIYDGAYYNYTVYLSNQDRNDRIEYRNLGTLNITSKIYQNGTTTKSWIKVLKDINKVKTLLRESEPIKITYINDNTESIPPIPIYEAIPNRYYEFGDPNYYYVSVDYSFVQDDEVPNIFKYFYTQEKINSLFGNVNIDIPVLQEGQIMVSLENDDNDLINFSGETRNYSLTITGNTENLGNIQYLISSDNDYCNVSLQNNNSQVKMVVDSRLWQTQPYSPELVTNTDLYSGLTSYRPVSWKLLINSIVSGGVRDMVIGYNTIVESSITNSNIVLLSPPINGTPGIDYDGIDYYKDSKTGLYRFVRSIIGSKNSRVHPRAYTTRISNWDYQWRGGANLANEIIVRNNRYNDNANPETAAGICGINIDYLGSSFTDTSHFPKDTDDIIAVGRYTINIFETLETVPTGKTVDIEKNNFPKYFEIGKRVREFSDFHIVSQWQQSMIIGGYKLFDLVWVPNNSSYDVYISTKNNNNTDPTDSLSFWKKLDITESTYTGNPTGLEGCSKTAFPSTQNTRTIESRLPDVLSTKPRLVYIYNNEKYMCDIKVYDFSLVESTSEAPYFYKSTANWRNIDSSTAEQDLIRELTGLTSTGVVVSTTEEDPDATAISDYKLYEIERIPDGELYSVYFDSSPNPSNLSINQYFKIFSNYSTTNSTVKYFRSYYDFNPDPDSEQLFVADGNYYKYIKDSIELVLTKKFNGYENVLRNSTFPRSITLISECGLGDGNDNIFVDFNEFYGRNSIYEETRYYQQQKISKCIISDFDSNIDLNYNYKVYLGENTNNTITKHISSDTTSFSGTIGLFSINNSLISAIRNRNSKYGEKLNVTRRVRASGFSNLAEVEHSTPVLYNDQNNYEISFDPNTGLTPRTEIFDFTYSEPNNSLNTLVTLKLIQDCDPGQLGIENRNIYFSSLGRMQSFNFISDFQINENNIEVDLPEDCIENIIVSTRNQNPGSNTSTYDNTLDIILKPNITRVIKEGFRIKIGKISSEGVTDRTCDNPRFYKKISENNWEEITNSSDFIPTYLEPYIYRESGYSDRQLLDSVNSEYNINSIVCICKYLRGFQGYESLAIFKPNNEPDYGDYSSYSYYDSKDLNFNILQWSDFDGDIINDVIQVPTFSDEPDLDETIKKVGYICYTDNTQTYKVTETNYGFITPDYEYGTLNNPLITLSENNRSVEFPLLVSKRDYLGSLEEKYSPDTVFSIENNNNSVEIEHYALGSSDPSNETNNDFIRVRDGLHVEFINNKLSISINRSDFSNPFILKLKIKFTVNYYIDTEFTTYLKWNNS